MRILVTGAAGFVGFHLSRRLLREGHHVVGADSVTDYYATALKRARLERLATEPGFRFIEGDLSDRAVAQRVFDAPFDVVVHLAAQAGVRHSISAPEVYAQANVVAFLEVLEGARRHPPRHVLYASSSSVYGDDTPQPFREDAPADAPVSLYAATKRAGELMASSYAHLYGLPLTGLRFFTVYGPWGRPDMAYFSFAEAIDAGRPITLYGNGELARDFTAVADVAEAIVRLLPLPPGGARPHRVLNIGAGAPSRVLEIVAALEAGLGKRAITVNAGMQAGDVAATWADTTALSALTGFRPATRLTDGLQEFVEWFRGEWPAIRSRGA